MAYLCEFNKSFIRGLSYNIFKKMPAPRPLVLCGPSGAGKSTLLQRLMSDFGECFGFSVSHTTRSPRAGEIDGTHYHFVTKQQMLTAIKQGQFIEHAEYSDNLYGTSRSAVHAVAESQRICVLDIETEGVKQVKKSDLDPIYVFIRPPSIQSLESRLRLRGTETEVSLGRRLSVARSEIEFGESDGNFDLIVTNDKVDEAYEQLRSFLLPEIEQLRTSRSGETRNGLKSNEDQKGQ